MRNLLSTVLLGSLASLLVAVAVAAPPGDGDGLATGPSDRAPGLSEGVERARFRWGRTRGDGWVLVATFDLTPGWHSYWLNPGESGDAPRIELSLPPGWQAGAPVFPRPDVRLVEGAPFYGYEGQASVLIPVTKANALSDDSWSRQPPPSGAWKADARIMACKSRCTVSRASARGDWPPVAELGEPIDLNGGSFEGRSLPRTAAKAGLFARLETGTVRIDVPGELGGSAAFVPASIPGLQIALPDGQASLPGAPGANGTTIKFRPDSLGEGPGQPAVAGLVLVGSGPSDPCVWLTIPHPLAGPGNSPGANGVGSSADAPPAP